MASYILCKKNFTFWVVIVAVGLHEISGLKCFQCQLRDGVGDAGCGENPPPEKYLRECAQPQCWLRYSSNGTFSVERFCVAVANNMNGCISAFVHDTKGMQHNALECKCNDSDGCNGNTPSGMGGGHSHNSHGHAHVASTESSTEQMM